VNYTAKTLTESELELELELELESELELELELELLESTILIYSRSSGNILFVNIATILSEILSHLADIFLNSS